MDMVTILLPEHNAEAQNWFYPSRLAFFDSYPFELTTFLILRSIANKAKTIHRGIRHEISFTNSLVSMTLLDLLLGEKFNSLERGKHKLFSTWISLHKSIKESGGIQSVSRALFRAWQVEKGRGARSGNREMPSGEAQGQGG